MTSFFAKVRIRIHLLPQILKHQAPVTPIDKDQFDEKNNLKMYVVDPRDDHNSVQLFRSDRIVYFHDDDRRTRSALRPHDSTDVTSWGQ